MEYNVWDTEAGSYLGKFNDEREALKFVKNLVDHVGNEYADSLSVGRVADNGTILAPLSGSDLVSRISMKIKG